MRRAMNVRRRLDATLAALAIAMVVVAGICGPVPAASPGNEPSAGEFRVDVTYRSGSGPVTVVVNVVRRRARHTEYSTRREVTLSRIGQRRTVTTVTVPEADPPRSMAGAKLYARVKPLTFYSKFSNPKMSRVKFNHTIYVAQMAP